MNGSGALAIFVKTPGVSPTKTRLGATIGQQSADHFYKLAVVATAARARRLQIRLPELQIFWAVAEEESLKSEIWGDFPTVFQGNGTLGHRLDYVYSGLLKKHSYVCFMGADSPHISSEQIETGIQLTAKFIKRRFVVGETIDGGFYFFGGSLPLSANFWHSVKYSTDLTFLQLTRGLTLFGGVELLNKDFDVDTIEDLLSFSKSILTDSNLLPEQLELINWARSFTRSLL